MTRRVAVRGIVLHEGRLLCARLKRYEGSVHVAANEWWCVPGGGLEDGEGLVDGICREMVEETGIAPQVGDLLYVQQFMHGGQDHLEIFFHITNAADYLHIDLNKTTHGATEIAEIAFIDPAEKLVLPKFLATENIVEKANSHSPVSLFAYV